MGRIVKQERERIDALASQYLKAVTEVKLCQVGYQSPETFILNAELLLIFELVG